MNRERAKELLPIIEAYSKGGTVQIRASPEMEWTDLASPSFTSGTDCRYRIKPEPHDIKWAAEQMMKGKAVRRSSWGNDEFRIDCNCNTIYGENSVGQGMRVLSFDLLADDWEIYEPKENK